MAQSNKTKREKSVDFVVNGFVLRSPLLPLSAIFDPAPSPFDLASEEGYVAACAASRARVRYLIGLPEVAEALFIATPVLVNSLQTWLDDPASDDAKRVERTLVSYLTRMAARPTPFGLFAGWSVGTIGDATRLDLGSRASYRRNSRLDMDYLFSLTEVVNRNAELRRHVIYRPNDTMVRAGGRFRYVEPRVGGGNTRRYHWVAAPVTPYLDCVLEAAAEGARIADLADALVRFDAQITGEEAIEYLNELIDEHVLMSTLQPPITGPEATADVAAQLRAFQQEDMARCLERAADALAGLDASGLGQPKSVYFDVAAILEELPAPVEVSRLVQVDMINPAELALGSKVHEEIERCAEWVVRYASMFERLNVFKNAFETRYGAAAVPLLQALDPETGIPLDELSGDNSPLLAGLPFVRFASDEGSPFKSKHGWLLGRLHQLWREGGDELVLEEQDLDLLFERKEPQTSTDAFHISCSVLAQSAEAADAGDFRIFFAGATGPGGARTLGRFADVDPAINVLVRQHVREEESLAKDVIFAEIAHLPQGRLGNVIRRPVLRDYELVYLARSGAACERQIPLSDVLVTVRSNIIQLWWARTGQRIVPRLTNAHNFALPGTLAPYRFLALLQGEGTRVGFSWEWGPLSAAPSLPRVRCGKIILARRSWMLDPADVAKLARGSRRERFVAAREVAAKHALPRLVSVLDGDNDFVIDFDHPLSVDAFLSLVKRRNGVRLSEVPAFSEGLCVSGEGGRFMHELHIPVVRKLRQPTANAAETRPLSAPPAVARYFAPGSEWLFAKIYAGGSEVDRVLRDEVRPLAAEAIGSGAADRWFFIRYRDPEPHLRLRFRGKPQELHGRLLPLLQHALAGPLKEGSVNRFMLDTYQPEIERYGGPVGLDLSECIFQADSEAIVELLTFLEGDDGAEARWQLALLGADRLIDDFGFSSAEKRALVARRRRDYGQEFRADVTGLKRGLGDRYRQERRTLEDVWSADGNAEHDLALGLTIWRARSEKLAPIATSLREADARGDLTASLSSLLDSHLHMSVNRLFRSQGREHELVLFDFLDRHYRSVDSRALNGSHLRG
jgi:thiopeptide-type bacteriocin biosynthesis protein